MISEYTYLYNLNLNKKSNTKNIKVIDDFLEWCAEVSPQYDFTYDWIKYVEKEQSENDVILFSIPPQHGKSTVFTIHKAAYFLEKYPNEPGIIISYNSDITSRFHRGILHILEKRKIPLYSKSQKEIVHENLMGSISFCGFQGGITSKPANWIIIDDPIKSAADAYSPNYQETLKSGFATSIIPRLQEKFKLYVTQTRWHDKDLIGQIITMNEELGANLKLKYINLPAICDSEDDPLGRKIGEVLCPQRFSLETIKTKMLLAEGDSYALYQGRPAPPEGCIFKSVDIESEVFSNLDELPKNMISFLSVDCAFKETKNSDYVAIGVYRFDCSSNNLFKIDTIRERADFDRTETLCEGLFKFHECSFALVEDKANGPAIITRLNRKFPNQFIAVDPQGGKISRAYAAQPFIRTRKLKVYRYMSNYNDYLNELKSFPKGPHDDMVDETTQAINYINKEYILRDYSIINEGYKSIGPMRF